VKSGGRRWYPSAYPYKDTSVNPDTWSQVAGGDTRVVIRTKTISVNPDPWSQVAGWDTQVVIHTNTLLLILTHEVRWHAGVPYGYPHLLSTRGKWVRWHTETNVIICTFCQPGASEPVDMQRLTSSSAPFFIQRRRVRWHARVPYGYPHLFSSRNGESDDMRGYLMVIRTFFHPETASPMTCGHLLLILTREVMWHAGVPYGYPHLLSTRGNRARWHAETNVIFFTFCHLETVSPMTCGGTLWLSAPFVNQRQATPLTRRD